MKRIKTFEGFNAIAVSCLISGLVGHLAAKFFVVKKTNDRNLKEILFSLKDSSQHGGFEIKNDGDKIYLISGESKFLINKKNGKIGYNFGKRDRELTMVKMNKTDFDVLVSGVEYIEKFNKEIPDCLQELMDFGFIWKVSSFDPMTKDFSIGMSISPDILFDDSVYSKKHKRSYAKFKEEVPPMLEEAIDRIEDIMNSKLSEPTSGKDRYSYYIKRHNGSLMAFGNSNFFIGDIYEDHFFYTSLGASSSGFILFFKTNKFNNKK